MQVKIEKKDGKIFVESPYSPELPEAAKRLGGKWDGSRWVFDGRDIDRVKSLYLDLYGEDGVTKPELVTVRVTCLEDWESEYGTGLFLFGRMVARGFGRDSGAKLGDGVILLNGELDTGGSRKYWYTIAMEGTVLEIRDVPARIVNDKNIPDDLKWEIIGEPEGPSKAALLEERQKLIDRINEIDELLE